MAPGLLTASQDKEISDMHIAKPTITAMGVAIATAIAAAQEPTPAPSPVDTVGAFHSALATGDREKALAWLDPTVLIFESGGAESSREEYASHHLAADIEFEKAVETAVLDRRHYVSGDSAWGLTRTRTTGRFRDRSIDALGVETMVLRRIENRWLIVHIHWSSRPKSG
jgi:hypothetical protein